jgi:predicted nucleic acid-binding protein
MAGGALMTQLQGLVLDTSVIIKWFRQGEILAEQAMALRNAYLGGQVSIAVPDLLAYELTNVLRFKMDLSTEQVCVAVQSLFDLRLDWHLPSSAVTRRAVQVARECDITVYDASFVALAESNGGVLVTADRRLVERLASPPHVRFLGDLAL